MMFTGKKKVAIKKITIKRLQKCASRLCRFLLKPIRIAAKKFSSGSRLLGCNSGVAALEASLTLPIVAAMIFFILEMMKVNNARTAVDSIALEATLEYIAQKNTAGFRDIINKYRPKYVAENQIEYHLTFYNSLTDMLSSAPYGNEDAYFGSKTTYLDTDKNGSYTGPRNSLSSAPADPTGKAFVLTVVCNYHFSSAFVAKFFMGGANSKDKKAFLIWGRGVGICH